MNNEKLCTKCLRQYKVTHVCSGIDTDSPLIISDCVVVANEEELRDYQLREVSQLFGDGEHPELLKGGEV